MFLRKYLRLSSILNLLIVVFTFILVVRMINSMQSTRSSKPATVQLDKQYFELLPRRNPNRRNKSFGVKPLMSSGSSSSPSSSTNFDSFLQFRQNTKQKQQQNVNNNIQMKSNPNYVTDGGYVEFDNKACVDTKFHKNAEEALLHQRHRTQIRHCDGPPTSKRGCLRAQVICLPDTGALLHIAYPEPHFRDVGMNVIGWDVKALTQSLTGGGFAPKGIDIVTTEQDIPGARWYSHRTYFHVVVFPMSIIPNLYEEHIRVLILAITHAMALDVHEFVLLIERRAMQGVNNPFHSPMRAERHLLGIFWMATALWPKSGCVRIQFFDAKVNKYLAAKKSAVQFPIIRCYDSRSAAVYIVSDPPSNLGIDTLATFVRLRYHGVKWNFQFAFPNTPMRYFILAVPYNKKTIQHLSEAMYEASQGTIIAVNAGASVNLESMGGDDTELYFDYIESQVTVPIILVNTHVQHAWKSILLRNYDMYVEMVVDDTLNATSNANAKPPYPRDTVYWVRCLMTTLDIDTVWGTNAHLGICVGKARQAIVKFITSTNTTGTNNIYLYNASTRSVTYFP
eukprot:PhF_6_TR14230/c0_g1_i1/m.22818